MSRKKRLFVPFAPFEQESMEKLLEKQANAGWMPTNIGSWLWTFEQADPRPLRFAVTYFSQATEYDPLPTDGQRDKESLCAQGGWKLAARTPYMQVFCTDNAAATPLETDPVVRVENLRRAMDRITVRPRLFTALLCLLWLLKNWLDLRHDAIDFLSDRFDVLTLPVWGLLLLACLAEIIACLAWYPKAKRMAEEAGLFLAPRIPVWVSWLCLGIVLILSAAAAFGSTLPPQWFLAWLFICVAAIAGGVLLRNHLRRKEYPAGLNKAATGLFVTAVYVVGIVVLLALSVSGRVGQPEHIEAGSYQRDGRTYAIYNDPLPLTVEDLTRTDAVYSREAIFSASPLLRRSEYSQHPIVPEYAGAPTVWYTVYDTGFGFVRDLVVDQLLREQQEETDVDGQVFLDSYTPLDPAPYGAQAAYQLQRTAIGPVPQYLLCWPGRVVELSFAYLVPTGEQLAAAAERLAPDV